MGFPHHVPSSNTRHDGLGDHSHRPEEENEDGPNLRASFANMHDEFQFDDRKDEKETSDSRRIRRGSSTLEEALTDSHSVLARFLLSEGNMNDEKEEGLFNPFLKSMRNLANIVTGEDEVNKGGSLGTNKAWFYSLALEPMHVRSERIVALAEAYSLFGALFLSGTWVLYEWGSGYGYGGCKYEEGDASYCHQIVDRGFEVVMALLITANLLQAMFSSFLWLMSILFSATHRNWVFGARNVLGKNCSFCATELCPDDTHNSNKSYIVVTSVLCHHLLVAIFVLTVLGVGLGLYAKLAPNWPEVGIALAFLLVTVGYGIYSIAHLCASETALEYYHYPRWFRWMILPYPMLRRGGRQAIKERAEKRANEIKSRALKEKSVLSDSAKASNRRARRTSVGMLLRSAADALGRLDVDISKFEQKLENDWYTESSELKGMSVDVLNTYMPRRLAEEVHRQLALEKVDATNSKSDGGHVSWKFLGDSDSSFESCI